MAKDEIDVAELLADGGIICTEAETRKILSAKVGGN